MPTQLCQVRHSGENLKNLIRTNSMSIGTVLFDISHLLNHITVDAGPSFPLPNGDVLLNRANISIGKSRISLPSGAQTVTAIGEPIPFINDMLTYVTVPKQMADATHKICIGSPDAWGLSGQNIHLPCMNSCKHNRRFMCCHSEPSPLTRTQPGWRTGG